MNWKAGIIFHTSFSSPHKNSKYWSFWLTVHLMLHRELKHLLVTTSYSLLSGNKAKWHYVLSVSHCKYWREINFLAWKISSSDFFFRRSVYFGPVHTPSTCTFPLVLAKILCSFFDFYKCRFKWRGRLAIKKRREENNTSMYLCTFLPQSTHLNSHVCLQPYHL